uniref:Reverse transcriptase domain-containing protein n=1 Tax=Tanacetum cinerariifolium TaxID=118510 RepID=A0A6L2KWT3_TANCI|nr:hypothetical protein [Tanacetum cinerariifolium]GEU57751.1 hypothetical protein [Tanacetum cinerariifolium]
MGAIDINTLTIEQYLALTRRDIPCVVISELGNDVDFEIKIQFLSELRCNLFAGTDDEDAYEHVQRVLEITDLFYISGVTHDLLMLRVFPITLTRETRRWKNLLSPGNGITDITKRIDNSECDMQNLQENIHAIQVGCKIYKEVHLTKECSLNNDDKEILTSSTDDEVKTKLRNEMKVKKESIPFDLPNVNSYGESTIPPIQFPWHFKEHEDEAQAFITLESLKKLKINRSLIRTIKRIPQYLMYVLWKPSRDFTRPRGPPNGLKGLLHMLDATVIPTKDIYINHFAYHSVMSHSTILIPSNSTKEIVGPSLVILSDTKVEVMAIHAVLPKISPEAVAVVALPMAVLDHVIESEPEAEPSKVSLSLNYVPSSPIHALISPDCHPGPDTYIEPIEDESDPIKGIPEVAEPAFVGPSRKRCRSSPLVSSVPPPDVPSPRRRSSPPPPDITAETVITEFVIPEATATVALVMAALVRHCRLVDASR